MMEQPFEIYLTNDPAITSPNAVKSRMSKARKAEGILRTSLDVVVSDDDRMYEALEELQQHENPKNNPMQNAVRKYYKFKNDKEFPRKKDYHSAKHP